MAKVYRSLGSMLSTLNAAELLQHEPFMQVIKTLGIVGDDGLLLDDYRPSIWRLAYHFRSGCSHSDLVPPPPPKQKDWIPETVLAAKRTHFASAVCRVCLDNGLPWGAPLTPEQAKVFGNIVNNLKDCIEFTRA
jgi:hypothetical protein